METLALVKAARHSATASAQVLEVLEQSLIKGETESVLSHLVDVLKKAGDTHEVKTAGIEPGPAVGEAKTESVKAPIEVLNDLLSGQYALRSMASLTEKTGLSSDGVLELLDANDVDYVIKTRRSDRAELVGLASRN